MFSSKKRINVVNLRGVIGDLGRFQKGLTFDNTNKIIERAFTFKKPHVVIININSPGGSPVQSELIYKKIRTCPIIFHGLPSLESLKAKLQNNGFSLKCPAFRNIKLNV